MGYMGYMGYMDYMDYVKKICALWQLRHTTFLQRYISFYTALSRYDEGFCCNIPVDGFVRFARSEKLTECWFLPSEHGVSSLFL